MRTSKAIVMTIAVLAVGALLLTGVEVFAQRGDTGTVSGSGQFQYVIKFACGQLFFDAANNPSGELDGAPGQYYTDINIHNPYSSIAKAHKKFALDGPKAQIHGPVTSPELFVLNPDEALQITCADIRRLTGQYPNIPNDLNIVAGAKSQFIKGFVVILTKFRLDITAIYSVCPPQTTGEAGGGVDLGCPASGATGDARSVTSLDVVYINDPSEVAAPSRLLPASLTTSQLTLGGELKLAVSARRMLALESARLMVYNLNGQPLYDSGFTSGTELRWRPLAIGQTVANGVYLYVVMARDVFGRVGYHVGKFIVLR